jgi:hypothetical protein
VGTGAAITGTGGAGKGAGGGVATPVLEVGIGGVVGAGSAINEFDRNKAIIKKNFILWLRMNKVYWNLKSVILQLEFAHGPI